MVNVNMIRDRQTLMLFGGVLALLVVATIVGQLIKLRHKSAVVDNLNARIKAWWVMSAGTTRTKMPPPAPSARRMSSCSIR